MGDEHEIDESGSVSTKGDYNDYSRAASMMVDIQNHGEVHATFEETTGEVEVRLGTANFNFTAGLIEIWDGDNYMPFSMDHLISWYKPMEVFHV